MAVDEEKMTVEEFCRLAGRKQEPISPFAIPDVLERKNGKLVPVPQQIWPEFQNQTGPEVTLEITLDKI